MSENYNTIAKRKGKEAQDRLKDFNLSEEIYNGNTETLEYVPVLNIEDVKQFIKRLKEEYSSNFDETWNQIIDKLAGNKLI